MTSFISATSERNKRKQESYETSQTTTLVNLILDEQCQRLQEPELRRSHSGGVPGVLRAARLQQHQQSQHQHDLLPRHHHHHGHWRDSLNQQAATKVDVIYKVILIIMFRAPQLSPAAHTRGKIINKKQI